MVGLPGAVVIDRLIVNHAPRGDDHPAEPRGGLAHRYSLQHSQTNISVKAVLDGLLPVERNLTGGMNCHRFSFLVNKNPQRRSSVHQSERLVLTTVES